MIVDCVSDLHGYYPELEGGDLLIVAGDLCAHDLGHQYQQFGEWIREQNYKKKVVIAGNHDGLIERGRWKIDPPDGFEYLCDSGTTLDYLDIGNDGVTMVRARLKIWGSPWTHLFPGVNPKCTAFMLPEEELAAKWALIPDDTDILVTHSPPIGTLDRVRGDTPVGSLSLAVRVGCLSGLKLHVFGHIHEGYGKIDLYSRNVSSAYLPNYIEVCKHSSVNASIMNEVYDPVNKPIRVIL